MGQSQRNLLQIMLGEHDCAVLIRIASGEQQASRRQLRRQVAFHRAGCGKLSFSDELGAEPIRNGSYDNTAKPVHKKLKHGVFRHDMIGPEFCVAILLIVRNAPLNKNFKFNLRPLSKLLEQFSYALV